jgi:eukaryotic-like serine/threonine-protein kinase
MIPSPTAADTVLFAHAATRSQATGLPADLLTRSVSRLRILALLYAFVFFMSDPLGVLFFPDERAAFLASPLRSLPSIASIAIALMVAAITASTRVPLRTTLRVGLSFEVAGSFGIAAAQYLDASRWTAALPWGGLSWVAVWMLSFTILVPSRPRTALLTGLASASSVPVVVAVVGATGIAQVGLTPLRFFFILVLPYLLVVLIAGVCAHIIYSLGTEITRARELGSYQLVERLDQGGMGEVWLARHRLLARPAAIKLMRPEMLGGSSPDRHHLLQARFEREAQTTASLRSPHTIELYDFGVAADGAFYYVMELLDGFNLQALVDRFGPVPAERAIHILRQICDSLGEAHEAGLVHRDVKPANVFVCRHGREVDFVKVLDFGLVKSRRESNGGGQTIVGMHAAGGTPAFMAPEQVLGDRPLDGRTDIYAAGCVGFWLLTGDLVFGGNTAMETMLEHAHTTPPRPSDRTELDIPAALDDLILACLSKDPDARPASADVLAARLAGIQTETPWTTARASSWWNLHHPALASTSTAAANVP